jgi:hypothetical protein
MPAGGEAAGRGHAVIHGSQFANRSVPAGFQPSGSRLSVLDAARWITAGSPTSQAFPLNA